MSRSRAGLVLAALVPVLLTIGLLPALTPGAGAATSWLDPTFGGGDGRIDQAWNGDLDGRLADSAVAPDGDLVVAVESAHIVWGCCSSDVGAWALARLDSSGALDPGFGGDGVVGPAGTAAPGSNDSVRPLGIDVDASGRILVAGGRASATSDDEVPVLVRRTGTGALDTSFGSGGTVVVPQRAECFNSERPSLLDVLALPGGKVLAAATCSSVNQDTSYFTVVTMRFTSTGALDTSYSGDGVATRALPLSVGACCSGDVVRLPDGRVVIGLGDGAIVRLLDTGAPDTTFGGGDGIGIYANVAGTPFVAFDDGRMVVASTYDSARRLKADGTLDTAYGDGGTVTFASTAVCSYPQLSSLVGTASRTVGLVTCSRGPDDTDNGGTVLSAMDSTGTADAAFGTRTSVVRGSDGDDYSYADSSILRTDGSGYLVLGSDTVPGMRVERRGSTGAIDAAYGTGGARHVPLHGRLFSLEDPHGARDAQGRLVTAVVAGNRGLQDEGLLLVSRYLPDGSPDPAFGDGGTRRVEVGGRRPLQGESGTTPFVVVNPDGTTTVVVRWADDLQYGPPKHEDALLVVRLTAGGDLDTATIPGGSRLTTVPGLGEDGRLGGVVPGAAGTVVVAYPSTTDQGDVPAAVRLLPDGAIDTSYAAGGVRTLPDETRSGNPSVGLLPLPGNEALLTWQQFTNDFDVDAFVAARLTSGGAVDTSYGTSGRFRRTAPGDVLAATTPTGRAVLAWLVRRKPDDPYDYSGVLHVQRLTAAGVPDTAFSGDGQATVQPASTSLSNYLIAVGASGERPLVLMSETVSRTSRLLVRLTSAGAPDTGFGTGGRVALDSSAVNAIGDRQVVLGRPDGPTDVLAVPYAGHTPDVLSVVRVLDRIVRLTGPTGTVLTGTAAYSWAGKGLASPATVATTSTAPAGSFGAWTNRSPTSTTSASVTLTAGRTVCTRVRDSAGLVTAPSCATSPLTATSLTAAGAWTKKTGTAFYRGQARTTKANGATLRATVKARGLAVVATTCSTCGSVAVLWNGTRIKTLSLQGAAKHRVVLPVVTWSAVRSGTVTLRVSSSAKPVTLEGLSAWRDDSP